MQRTTSDLRDLAKSLVSLSGAASMFGVSQLGRLLDIRTPIRSADAAARRLDSVTRTVTDQLQGRLWTAFDRTDVLQRNLVDFVFDLATLDVSSLIAFGAPALEPLTTAMDPLVAVLDRVLPGTGAEVRWLELKNKIEIYFLVENAATRLQISPVERTPLSELVERAYALGPFLALWAIEGLGHVYGDQALRENPSPRGLLTGPESDAVWPGALSMLHAGIGLAFAQTLLVPVKPDTAATALPTVIRDFVQLCNNNSRPGYVGAAYESLGLFAQSFHTDLVTYVNRELQRSAGDLLGYYWHGVGRATYFAPRNFLPSVQIDWSSAPMVAPHEIGRLNFTAGLAWAVTLVNMRQPVIMERLLGQHGAVLSQNAAFADGVASSIAMRQDTTPGVPFLETFLQYRPDPGNSDLVRLWEIEVRQPAEAALRCTQKWTSSTSRIGELFQFPMPSEYTDPRGRVPPRSSV